MSQKIYIKIHYIELEVYGDSTALSVIEQWYICSTASLRPPLAALTSIQNRGWWAEPPVLRNAWYLILLLEDVLHTIKDFAV